MSDSEWFSAACPSCGVDARWQAVRNDGMGPPKLTILCMACGPICDDQTAIAAVIKGDESLAV